MKISDLFILESLNDQSEGGGFMKDILAMVKFIVSTVLLMSLAVTALLFWILLSQNVIRF